MDGIRAYFQRLLLAAAAGLLLSSCGGCSLPLGITDDPDHLSFLVYNVCNLFDDRSSGTEYPDFDPEKGSWTAEKYRAKLERTGKVLRDACRGGADFVALVEIENEGVIRDLHEESLKDLGYLYSGAAVAPGAPAGIGFLSRFPVLEARTHAPAMAGFPQRPVFEVKLDLAGSPLTVFICHFKAKSEGAEATEANRIESARTILFRTREILLSDPEADILLLGDLNENADEFQRVEKRYTTALMPPEEGGEVGGSLIISGDKAPGGGLVFFSPWLDDPPFPGSYRYHETWETIDHALLSPGLLDTKGLVYDTFTIVTKEYLLDSSGSPVRDYSDHLPILLALRKEGK